jgi:hypothetical protein
MTPQEIQERNKQIALMLGLKPLGRPYDGAFITDDNTDNSFRIFFNGLLEGESWYQYPEFHRDWNWIMEAVQFLHRHFKSKEMYWTGIESYRLYSEIESVFVMISGLAKLYNEKKLYN